MTVLTTLPLLRCAIQFSSPTVALAVILVHRNLQGRPDYLRHAAGLVRRTLGPRLDERLSTRSIADCSCTLVRRACVRLPSHRGILAHGRSLPAVGCCARGRRGQSQAVDRAHLPAGVL
ncbi:hypothetical protein FB45DRAFT_906950, partial [Roridomyces roridus]